MWELLYEEFWDKLEHFCYKLCRDDGRAEDLTQEVFLRALQNRSLIENFTPGQCKAWLFAAARNLYCDQVRRAVKEESLLALLDPDDAETPDETAEAALARGDLFVQEQNGEIVGTAILNQNQVDSYAGANWRYDAPDSEVMVLHTLVIDPEAKSRGLGREFAAFYEGYALAHGCRYLRIDTNARNARARRFYQKLGYAEIGVVPCTFNGIAGVQLVLLEKRLPPLRQITADEAPRLRACVQALSEHHNRVSVNFKGSYPSRSYDKTLSLFAQALEENVSRIAVIEEDSGIVGFCKVDLHGDGTGKLDYLVVLPQCRGRKYGKALMDWAMAVFSGSGVRKIEVKVVDGNDAVHLYEKYGFRMNAHILVRGE